MQNADPGSRRICPVDGYFNHRKTHFLRQQQNLNIKGKPINSLSAKDLVGGTMPEALEPALRVPHTQPGHLLGNTIEDFSHQLTTVILMQQDLSFRVLPIAHDHVNRSVFGEAQKAGIQVLERGTEVRIGKKDETTLGAQHPTANRKPFSAPLVMGQDQVA
jgi:hypothetical protein